ncbi:MAG: DUF1211 domain-containing protein [Deltaproteobacteria bacterium]|nr:DUF1211 domain-containing protein [Deltaproteobacteria bacterium]
MAGLAVMNSGHLPVDTPTEPGRRLLSDRSRLRRCTKLANTASRRTPMPADGAARETGRVEALSDGVFAIAVTLLGFTLRAPMGAGEHLATYLMRSWPAFVSFMTSFATIWILWINHHRLFTHIRKVDHSLLLLNGLLLMAVTVIPFATTLVAEYAGHPGGRTAALFYSGTFIAVTTSFNILWQYSARGHRLLDQSVDAQAIHRINLQYGFGPVLYVVSFALAWESVWASLAANGIFAAFFALPALDWSERRRPPTEPPRRRRPAVPSAS